MLVRWLERLFKWLLLLSLPLFGAAYLGKDKLPDPAFYGAAIPGEPRQSQTLHPSFMTEVNGQQYHIDPLFDYVLEGVVVSYHDADAITDITHHRRWQDFLNVRDLCVIWGENLASGVYQEMQFHNDSWTCWASWPDRATGDRFHMTQLSNNHLLVDDPEIKRRLLAAAPGDRVRLRGTLANYANPANGFRRNTSTVRTDTGNGACETVYLREFSILQRANPGMRNLFTTTKWLLILSLSGFLIMLFIAPVAKPRFR